MLIIGHRGAAGLAPENSLEALRAGVAAGCDMLEFDVRLTKDKVPIIIHDPSTLRTHKKHHTIGSITAAELAASDLLPQIVTLESVLNEFFGKILLNLELKSRGSAPIVIALLKKYVKHEGDWDNVILTSFLTRELLSARKVSHKVNLGLLHYHNPFIFVALQRRLELTAVGFHRLYLNRFATEIARRSGLFTYVYTVNRPATALMMETKGMDGIVSDRPDVIAAAFDSKAKSTKQSRRK